MIIRVSLVSNEFYKIVHLYTCVDNCGKNTIRNCKIYTNQSPVGFTDNIINKIENQEMNVVCCCREQVSQHFEGWLIALLKFEFRWFTN